MNEVDTNAKIIWDYMLLHQELKAADAILVFGSHDIRAAERGAGLFLEGWAPWLVFSGGFGSKAPSENWDRPEEDVFVDVAIQKGIPSDKILKEREATNSEENVTFTRKLLEETGLPCSTFIVVHKPYMERRTFATFKNFWPEPEIIIASPQIAFEEYSSTKESRERMVNLLVSDLQRIKEYPKKGFQIPQDIPENVWNAYEELVERGYTKYLIKT